MSENNNAIETYGVPVSVDSHAEIEDKEHRKFKRQLKANPALYSKGNNYFRAMRSAKGESCRIYNRVKNELMSYELDGDTRTRIKYRIGRRSEIFASDKIVAQIKMAGSVVCLYLALDPSKHSTGDIVYKTVDDDKRYRTTPVLVKIAREAKLQTAVDAIQAAMTEAGCVKNTDYTYIDYASFFKEPLSFAGLNVDEDLEEERTEALLIDELIDESEDEPIPEEAEDTEEPIPEVAAVEYLEEEIAEAQETIEVEEVAPIAFENISAPSNRPVFRDLQNADRLPEDERHRPLRKTIFDVEEEKKEDDTEKKKKKKNLVASQAQMWQELSDYGFHFVPAMQLLCYLIVTGGAIGISLLYKLNLIFSIIVILSAIIVLPGILTAYYRNKYEEKHISDAETYIEQMLYSFKRSSKIVVALRDALIVFPSGHMHDKIVEAMEYMRSSGDDPRVYEHALSIIEDAYPCRRIQSLHRYMIKVEGVGGDHDAGINALLRDRRLWIDRNDAFRKQCSGVIREIIISIVFSMIMACVVVYLMPSDVYDISSNLIYQILTTVFVVTCMIVVRLTYSTTVINLDDRDDETHERMAKRLEWLRNYDPKVERAKSRTSLIMYGALGVLGAILWIIPKGAFDAQIGNTIQNVGMVLTIAGILASVWFGFLRQTLAVRSAKKAIQREIEKVYPDWLLELTLLLQTDNMHVAIEKTLADAPAVLRQDLEDLADDIMVNPNDLTPYAAFFNFLNLPSVRSSMKLLYSMAEFGSTDESLQLAELVERNHILMDKAEQYKNDDKIALVFSIKFLPALASSLKMLVDMLIFLFSYMGAMNI